MSPHFVPWHLAAAQRRLGWPRELRYDRWRIVPESEVASLPGVAMDVAADPTAQSTMMRAELPLPEGCEALEVWFSHVDAAGQTRWDLTCWRRSGP